MIISILVTLIGAGENRIRWWCFMIISILVTLSIEIICIYHRILLGRLQSTEIYTSGNSSQQRYTRVVTPINRDTHEW